MNNLSERIIDIVSKNIQPELLYESIVFWNQRLMQKGDIVKAGGENIKFHIEDITFLGGGQIASDKLV